MAGTSDESAFGESARGESEGLSSFFSLRNSVVCRDRFMAGLF